MMTSIKVLNHTTNWNIQGRWIQSGVKHCPDNQPPVHAGRIHIKPVETQSYRDANTDVITISNVLKFEVGIPVLQVLRSERSSNITDSSLEWAITHFGARAGFCPAHVSNFGAAIITWPHGPPLI